MPTSRSQPTEEQWLQQKSTIRRLYLIEGCSLNQLLAGMARLGLTVTKAQMEYRLKKWRFRRYIDAASWVSIDHTIKKRKRLGKESQVVHNGKRLKLSTVNKETNRYRDNCIFSQLPTAPSPPPTSPMGNEIIVCTPPPSFMEFNWPSSLPWLKFKALNAQFILKSGSDGSASHAIMSPSTLPISMERSLDKSTVVARNQVLPFAAQISTSVPESYPGENPERDASLLSEMGGHSLSDHLTRAIYSISNNLSDLLLDNNWEVLLGLIRDSGLVNVKVDLRDIQDATVQAFICSIFGWSVLHIKDTEVCRGSPSQAIDSEDESIDSQPKAIDTWQVFKWALSSGQSPDIALPHRDGETPLTYAIASGKLSLVEKLLEAGADPNFVVGNKPGGHRPLERSLRGHGRYHFYGNNERGVRMANLLLKFGASGDWNRMLWLAILNGSFQLATHFIQQGADPAAVEETDGGYRWQPYLCKNSILSAAAFVGLVETHFVLGCLVSREPRKSKADFLTADIAISAAAQGQDSVLRYLDDIKASLTAANAYGVTPLHIAASNGDLRICKLLLELQGRPESNPAHPSPLHLASFSGRYTQVIQLLLDSGCDVNEVVLVEKEAILRYDSSADTVQTPGYFTPLQILFASHRDRPFRNRAACAMTLIKAGARLTGCELHVAIQYHNLVLLETAILAGADLNCIHDGRSALEVSLGWYVLHNEAAARLLLKHGAELRGGEVILAILAGSWDLVDLMLANGGCLKDIAGGVGALEAAASSPDPAESIHRLVDYGWGHYDAGALCAAIYRKSQQTIERVLQLCQSFTQAKVLDVTALGLAAMSGDIGLVRTLLGRFTFSNPAKLPFSVDDKDFLRPMHAQFWYHKSSVEGSPLTLAAEGKKAEGFEELLANGFEPDRITWAACAENGNLAAAQSLVDKGKRVDHSPELGFKYNLLKEPIGSRNNALVSLLLEAGASLDQPYLDVEFGRSPLQQAVEAGNLDTANCLLENGADINDPPARERGGTALQLAAIKGYLGLAKYLLELGADVNAAPAASHGRTALEGAAEHGRIDMVAFLLHHGALTTGPGRLQYVRAVKLARKGGHYAAAEILTEFQGWTEEDEQLSNDAGLVDDDV